MLKLLIKQNEEDCFGFLCVQEESRNTQGKGFICKFEYYYRAEPDGRSFRINGETLAGL